MAAPLHGHGTGWMITMSRPAVRLSNPGIVREVASAITPMRRRARAINAKKAIVARLCGRSIVRGNIPMAAIAIEPRIRQTIASLPDRPEGRLLPRPRANIRLSKPVRISPQLNRAVAEPSTPRTLMWFSVQLNQGDLEMATHSTVRPTRGEAMPQRPAILLSTAPSPNLTFNHSPSPFK